MGGPSKLQLLTFLLFADMLDVVQDPNLPKLGEPEPWHRLRPQVTIVCPPSSLSFVLACESCDHFMPFPHISPCPGLLQKDAAGVKALWRVEGVAGSAGESNTDAGFIPSILFVAYRFGFEQGSEKLLLHLVRDAVSTGWRVTVFGISLKKVPALEGLPNVTITSDAKVLASPGAFDLMCIHV